jgi:hypothetical protein
LIEELETKGFYDKSKNMRFQIQMEVEVDDSQLISSELSQEVNVFVPT